MIRTSYLRVYRPLAELSVAERKRWRAYENGEEPPVSSLGRRWLIFGRMPAADQPAAEAEGAFVRRIDDQLYVCPWHTRLRMLTALLAFRGSLPDEVADVFVPESEARRAAEELVALEDTDPDARSYILHANWHVPLRWFGAFSDEERILTEDREGLRVRYQTSVTQARDRLTRAIQILEGAWIDAEIVDAVRNLTEWLSGFGDDCVVELDYGSVAGMFTDDDLVDDHSAAQVWDCLGALAAGDVAEAGRLFGEMTDRWSEVRAFELSN